MLDAIRITVSGQTASFRVPGFLAYQLTLPVPALSTVYGLLSAAAGRWVLPPEVDWLGYRCEYDARAMDLEAIITYDRPKPEHVARPEKRNVIWREFLVRPRLTLYLSPSWKVAFERPRYPLVLGRSQDLATVEGIEQVKLQHVDQGEVSGVLLPLGLAMESRAPAWIYNLPITFGPEPGRRPLGMQPFGVLDFQLHRARVTAPQWLARDESSGVTVPVYRREWVVSVISR